MERDREHLRWLSIFHYVMAALVPLGGLCFGGIYMSIGLVALIAPDQMLDEHGQPMPPWFGWIFTIAGAVPLILSLLMGVLLIVAGRSLAAQRRYVFCLVVAGLNCLIFPPGTVLGVFTLIVLFRPGVRDLFQGASVDSRPAW